MFEHTLFQINTIVKWNKQDISGTYFNIFINIFFIHLHQNNVPIIEVKVLVQRNTVQTTNLDQETDLNYLQTDLFEESLSKYFIDANSLLSFVKHIHHHNNNLTASIQISRSKSLWIRFTLTVHVLFQLNCHSIDSLNNTLHTSIKEDVV